MERSTPPLVVHFGQVGDMINLTALLRALSVVWGAPCDVLCSGGAPERVLRGLDSVGETRTLESRKTPYWAAPEQRRLVRWLRRRGATPTYVLDGLAKVDWLLDRGGIPAGRRVTPGDCPRGDLEHVVDYMLRLGRRGPALLPEAPRRRFPEPPPRPEVTISPVEDADARRWLAALGWRGEPLVLLQTEARRMNRGRWPEERWRELIAAVLARLPEAWALLIGAPHEQPRTAALAAACADRRVLDVAGDLPLRRLFAVLPYAHSCFSLDTGPAHAAAALGCPVVVLMGRADPRRNRPYGSPSEVQVAASWPEERWPPTCQQWWDTHTMAGIEVATVLAAWDRLAPRQRASA
jgi:Glycosyltransferase family 9 (heptosyltransferase)